MTVSLQGSPNHFKILQTNLPGTSQEAGSTSTKCPALVTSAVNESAGHTGTKEFSQKLILPMNCLGLVGSPRASLGA